MPEGEQIPEQHHQLKEQAYQWTKSRIEASNRIAAELKRHDPQSPIVQEATRFVNHEGTTWIDARGYAEQRTRMVYHSPGEQESVSEDLVFFLKAGQDGEPHALLGENEKPVFLNAALYDARFAPAPYTVRLGESKFDVPHVNHEGQITKMTKVIKLSSDAELAQKGGSF